MTQGTPGIPRTPEAMQSPKVRISLPPGLSLTKEAQAKLDELMTELQKIDREAAVVTAGCQNYVSCGSYT